VLAVAVVAVLARLVKTVLAGTLVMAVTDSLPALQALL
jgi:hypothetical protein